MWKNSDKSKWKWLFTIHRQQLSQYIYKERERFKTSLKKNFQYNYIRIRFGSKHVWELKAPTTNKNTTFVIVTYLTQLTKWIMCNVHDRTHIILLLVVGAKPFLLYLEGLKTKKPILSMKGSFGPGPNSIPEPQKMGLAWSWGWQLIKN